MIFTAGPRAAAVQMSGSESCGRSRCRLRRQDLLLPPGGHRVSAADARPGQAANPGFGPRGKFTWSIYGVNPDKCVYQHSSTQYCLSTNLRPRIFLGPGKRIAHCLHNPLCTRRTDVIRGRVTSTELDGTVFSSWFGRERSIEPARLLRAVPVLFCECGRQTAMRPSRYFAVRVAMSRQYVNLSFPFSTN